MRFKIRWSLLSHLGGKINFVVFWNNSTLCEVQHHINLNPKGLGAFGAENFFTDIFVDILFVPKMTVADATFKTLLQFCLSNIHLLSLIFQWKLTVLRIHDYVNITQQFFNLGLKIMYFLNIWKCIKIYILKRPCCIFLHHFSTVTEYSCSSGTIHDIHFWNKHVLYILLVCIMSMYHK